jgi:hypothetical protein
MDRHSSGITFGALAGQGRIASIRQVAGAPQRGRTLS